MRRVLMALTFLFVGQVNAQTTLHAYTGLSYLEHVSTGISLRWKNRHQLSLMTGTNLFIRTYYFANYMAQYDYLLKGLKVLRATPKVGIKGGDSIFSDDYYRWHVVHIIPQVGFQYPLKPSIELVLEAGAAASFEQKVKRLKQGELGHYEEWLPEIKVAVMFQLSKQKSK